ncbi:MAG: peptidylprolyl isomerase [Gemmatimonadetes bacterium]|nr:peptidylprolyl isomerase [Gemmatimonadota bacterium]
MPRLLVSVRWLALALVLGPRAGGAQSLTRADSALVGRILVAEDRRDAADGALAEGARHADARVRAIAARAAGRIADPLFTSRTALPAVPPPPIWVEPAWRIRHRALASMRDDCSALRLAASDSAWPVRFRAAALVRETCAADEELVQTFLRWIREIPSDVSRRKRGQVAWQGAANGLLAVARIRPAEARWALSQFTGDPDWHLRQYAARAAGILGDTATVRRLASDRDDNVAEAAIGALSRLTGHADDALYLAAIDRRGAQVVRAGAMALKGSPRADVAPAATRAFERWVARENASAHDARAALLEAAGRPASEDRPPPVRVTLPRDAVALALGQEIRLRVTMDRASGGGRFDVRLRGDVAPMMAARILALVRDGYYDGLSWHRVEHDFVIQGGSPGANEYVGLPQFLRDELGTVTHARGTLGMSTRGHDTGDAQWFVNLRDNARLDRDYTVWGEIVAGIDVVDGVLEGDIINRIRVLK